MVYNPFLFQKIIMLYFYHFIKKLDDRIKERYLKSNIISSYDKSSNKEDNLTEFSVDDSKTLPLNLEEMDILH